MAYGPSAENRFKGSRTSTWTAHETYSRKFTGFPEEGTLSEVCCVYNLIVKKFAEFRTSTGFMNGRRRMARYVLWVDLFSQEDLDKLVFL